MKIIDYNGDVFYVIKIIYFTSYYNKVSKYNTIIW